MSIPILYLPTNETFETMLISIASLIQNNGEKEFKLVLGLDSSFDEENIAKIKAICSKHSQIKEIVIHKIDESKYMYFKNNRKLVLTSRLYIFDCVELFKEKFIYFAEQTIITGDINELYDIDITDYVCAVAEYIDPKTLIREFDLKNKIIFSTNMLLVNPVKWKEEKISDKFFAKEFMKDYKNAEPIKNWLFFNLLIDNYKLLTCNFDYTEEWLRTKNRPLTCSVQNKKEYNEFLTHVKTPLVVCVGNPLNSNELGNRNSYLSLWWKYAEQTPIYKDIKEFRQLNKYKLQATSAQNSFKYSWLLSRIFPYIKPYIPRIVIGFLIAIPLGLLDGVTALALKPYMDYVVGKKALEFSFIGQDISISSLAMAFLLPIGVILFAIIQGVLKYLNDYISAWTSQRITNDVKFDLFHRLIHMHPQFFDDNSSGIVISRYMSDPATASAGIVDQIKTITTSLCGALGLIGVMVYSSWKLAFIGVLVLCIAFIPVALIRKRIKETSNKNMVIGGNITTNINETYSGNKVMAAYDLQDRQENYFKKQVWKSFNINMSLTKRTAWMSPLMYLIASFGIAIVLGYGTYLINTGHMTAGSFASFVTSLLLLYKPVKTLGGTLTGIQNIFVAMGRVFELFDLAPAIKDCENPKTLNGFEKSIEFKDVYFEYIPNKPVLKDINLTIPKNETLAIVGNSGGGKSTLVNLIPRFYDIKSGSIKIDGTDICEFSLKSLRNNISMVFQDNFLYTGTIKDNILMGNPNATAQELMEAIKSAHLQDMIKELPEGLETELGERGLTLSGGQRQRVAIARAMLRNAPIVILDEATSALDNQSEAVVQKAMDNLMQNRTVFIIAHRLSTIKNADRIAVINEGELVELGNHNELMQIENGQYKHLYEMQFRTQEN